MVDCSYYWNVRGAVVVLLDQTDYYSGPALSDYFIACHVCNAWFCCVVRRRTGSLASSLFPWRTSSEQRKRGRFRCLDAKGRGGTHQWLDGTHHMASFFARDFFTRSEIRHSNQVLTPLNPLTQDLIMTPLKQYLVTTPL